MLVYFKVLQTVDARKVAALHRLFWNHGGAPILAIIAANEVQIYSGLARPASDNSESTAFVATLARASLALKQFLPAVQSGEFFRQHAKSFQPTQRVDRSLLDNLGVAVLLGAPCFG